MTKVHFDQADPSMVDWHSWAIRPGGYLEAIEVEFSRPIPNMDAAYPIRFEIRVLQKFARHDIDLSVANVRSRWREIEAPDIGKDPFGDG